MAIPEHARTNFNTPLRAAGDGNLALMECLEAVTGEPRYVLCAVGRDDGDYIFVPFGHLADGNLRLLGYDRHIAQLAGGPSLQVVFYWQPLTQLDRRYKLSFRLLDAAGTQLAQEDRFPLRQVASTSDWLPTEIVCDVHDLPLPAEATQLLVILYDEETLTEAGRVEIPLR